LEKVVLLPIGLTIGISTGSLFHGDSFYDLSTCKSLKALPEFRGQRSGKLSVSL